MVMASVTIIVTQTRIMMGSVIIIQTRTVTGSVTTVTTMAESHNRAIVLEHITADIMVDAKAGEAVITEVTADQSYSKQSARTLRVTGNPVSIRRTKCSTS